MKKSGRQSWPPTSVNRLTHKPPAGVEVDGQWHPLHTGHRGCLLTLEALGDSSLLPAEKAEVLLGNLFVRRPANGAAAVERALWFLQRGQAGEGGGEPLYSFTKDADLIYQAFLTKGVDLDKEELHWWCFLDHFASLPQSAFTHILYLRQQLRRGRLTPQEKQQCADIGWERIQPLVRDEEFEKLLRGEEENHA